MKACEAGVNSIHNYVALAVHAFHGDVNASRPHQRVGDRFELRVTAPFRSKAALQWNGSGRTRQDTNTTTGPAGKTVQESTNPRVDVVSVYLSKIQTLAKIPNYIYIII